MKLDWKKLMLAAPFMALSAELLASDGDASEGGLMKIAAGLAIGLGAFGAATAQGRAGSAALEGLSRNPASSDAVFVPMILSLVFMELQALLCFVVSLMILGKI